MAYERSDSVARGNYVASRPLSIKGCVIHVRWPSEAVGTEKRAVDGFGEPSYDTYFPSDAYLQKSVAMSATTGAFHK